MEATNSDVCFLCVAVKRPEEFQSAYTSLRIIPLRTPRPFLSPAIESLVFSHLAGGENSRFGKTCPVGSAALCLRSKVWDLTFNGLRILRLFPTATEIRHTPSRASQLSSHPRLANARASIPTDFFPRRFKGSGCPELSYADPADHVNVFAITCKPLQPNVWVTS